MSKLLAIFVLISTLISGLISFFVLDYSAKESGDVMLGIFILFSFVTFSARLSWFLCSD